jgi:hypothetical protein
MEEVGWREAPISGGSAGRDHNRNRTHKPTMAVTVVPNSAYAVEQFAVANATKQVLSRGMRLRSVVEIHSNTGAWIVGGPNS